MTPVWRNRLIGLVIAAAVYALDRWIKALVVGPWRLREVEVIELLPFFDLRWTRNFGVSLGMFEATSIEMRWALVAVTGLIAVVVLAWLLRFLGLEPKVEPPAEADDQGVEAHRREKQDQ